MSFVFAENSRPALPTFAAPPRKTLPPVNCSPPPVTPLASPSLLLLPHVSRGYLWLLSSSLFVLKCYTPSVLSTKYFFSLAVPSVTNPAPAELGVLAFSGYLWGAISKALILLTAIGLVWFSSQIITVSGLYKEFKFIFIQMSRWIGKLRQELDFVPLPEARSPVFLLKSSMSTRFCLSGCNYHSLSLALLIWVSLALPVMLQLPRDAAHSHTNHLSNHSLS